MMAMVPNRTLDVGMCGLYALPERSKRFDFAPAYPTPYTLHRAPCTLHPAPYTLHHIPCTLYPTPYWGCGVHPTGVWGVRSPQCCLAYKQMHSPRTLQ